MAPYSTIAPLPLRSTTPPIWAYQVLRQPLTLLNDHAHLEKKAASNALELLNRWPPYGAPSGQEQWIATLAGVAKDEIEHLTLVNRLLARRGGRMTARHRNAYAADLRQLVRSGRGPEELMDRLMVSALIELRSCERFEVLSNHCQDEELAKFYRGLSRSERGHYQVFIEFARQLAGSVDSDRRWDQMLDSEATILDSQPPGPRMHSGVGREACIESLDRRCQAEEET